MTAPYRTPEASLRAEVERLTRELATMRSPARRWTVTGLGRWLALGNAVGAAFWTAAIAGGGWTDANVAGAAMNAVAWTVWAFGFGCRVPVDGGGE